MYSLRSHDGAEKSRWQMDIDWKYALIVFLLAFPGVDRERPLGLQEKYMAYTVISWVDLVLDEGKHMFNTRD